MYFKYIFDDKFYDFGIMVVQRLTFNLQLSQVKSRVVACELRSRALVKSGDTSLKISAIVV